MYKKILSLITISCFSLVNVNSMMSFNPMTYIPDDGDFESKINHAAIYCIIDKEIEDKVNTIIEQIEEIDMDLLNYITSQYRLIQIVKERPEEATKEEMKETNEETISYAIELDKKIVKRIEELKEIKENLKRLPSLSRKNFYLKITHDAMRDLFKQLQYTRKAIKDFQQQLSL